jgi:hypothetical protein
VNIENDERKGEGLMNQKIERLFTVAGDPDRIGYLSVPEGSLNQFDIGRIIFNQKNGEKIALHCQTPVKRAPDAPPGLFLL